MKYLAMGLGAAAIALLGSSVALAQSGPSLRLYADTGFGGDSRRLDRGVDNLRAMEFDNQARSLIADGRWELCLDARYGGECRVVQGRVSDMGTWNGQVSSARYLGPADWGAGGEGSTDSSGAMAYSSGQVGASAGATASGPQYRLDHRPDMIGGVYETDFGQLTLERFDRLGVAGRYDGNASDRSDSGTFEGTMILADHQTDGHDRVEGYWYAQTAAQACSTERNGTRYWGRMQFNFPRAGRDFIGFWGYCEATALDRWNGTYAGHDPAIQAAVNAQMASQPAGQTYGQATGPWSGQPGPVPPQTPVDAQGRPLPGVVDRAAQVAADEAERRAHDRIREGIGRIF